VSDDAPADLAAAVLALLTAFGFGLANVLMKRGLQHARPQAAALVSVTFTALFMDALALVAVPPARLATWAVLPFVVAGLFAPGLGRLLLFHGIDRVGVGRSLTMVATTPLFSVILAIALLGERPSWPLLLGVAAIVAGAALLSYRPAADASWRRRSLVFPLLAALSFALRDLVTRWGLTAYAEPVLGAAVSASTSFAIFWGSTLLHGGVRGLGLSARGFRVLVLAGLCEGGAYLAMWWALAIGHVSLVSPLVNAHALFALALAAIFLRDLERTTWRAVVAAALVVIGVSVVIRFGTA
jgi:uncharacterized membrane protein